MKLNEELSRIKGLMKVSELNESDDKVVKRFQKIIDDVDINKIPETTYK